MVNSATLKNLDADRNNLEVGNLRQYSSYLRRLASGFTRSDLRLVLFTSPGLFTSTALFTSTVFLTSIVTSFFSRKRSTKPLSFSRYGLLAALTFLPIFYTSITSADVAPKIYKKDQSSGNKGLSSFYWGIGAGLSDFNLDDADSGWRVADTSDLAFKLFAGYKMNPRWSAELSWSALGEAEIQTTDTSPTITQGLQYDVPALTAAYVINAPEESWNVYVLGGISQVISKNVGDQEVYEEGSSTEAVYGIGLKWCFSPRVAARVEAQSFGSDVRSYMFSMAFNL